MRSLVLFIALAAILTQHTLALKCSQGCVTCKADNCEFCYKRKYVGNQCSSQVDPASTHCQLYMYPNSDRCQRCVDGYVVSEQGQCVRTSLNHCYSGLIRGGNEFCFICETGYYPTDDHKTCLPASRFTIEKPDPNCLQGANLGGVYCAYCKPGYMAVPLAPKCYPQTIPGCAVANSYARKKCLQCDFLNGYFMLDSTKPTVCTKVGVSEAKRLMRNQ